MKLSFVKYSGNGNDFIIVEENRDFALSSSQIQKLCSRHFGVGADGVLLLGKPEGVDASMRIFNADGGEAEMCGNGLRCLATYLDQQTKNKKEKYLIRTMNNTYEVGKRNGAFAILMNDIKDENAVDLSEFRDYEKKFYINTGVPHLVFLGKDVKKIDIKKSAPAYRFHARFPRGTNVSFVELLPGQQCAYVRTYERGVEDETHSCGTGLTASGLALSHWFGWKGDIHLETLGGKQIVSVEKSVYYSGEVTFCFAGEVEL
ncbi:MAG: diaminopimelate epimerase [Bacteriovoracaceae bacterium]